jgi:hypothetical protein
VARRFLIRAFGLERPQGLPSVSTMLDQLEFIQMDSINVCGRIHDLICWSRLPGYEPTQLHDFLYAAPRRAFEYYFPNLCVLPMGDYPYFVRAMRARAETPGRWAGLMPEEIPVAERVLAHIKENGPVRTRAANHASDGHTLSGWGMRRTVASHVIEKLWLRGRLVIARRDNFERTFDLAENRLPPDLLAADLPDEHEERVFKAQKRLCARRLFRPSANDRALLGASAFVPVNVAGVARPWFVLAHDAATLADAQNVPVDESAVNLLAPLDPLVYDRQRTRDLWGFDYTWEVYTPAAKRRWGYYVLPILWGDTLAGRVDPKIDRKTGTLTLHALILEPGVNPERIAAPLAARLADFARFLGAARIEMAKVEPKSLRTLVIQAASDFAFV